MIGSIVSLCKDVIRSREARLSPGEAVPLFPLADVDANFSVLAEMVRDWLRQETGRQL